MIFDRLITEVQVLKESISLMRKVSASEKRRKRFKPTREQKIGLYGSILVLELDAIVKSMESLSERKGSFLRDSSQTSPEEDIDHEILSLQQQSRDLVGQMALFDEKILTFSATNLTGLYQNWEAEKTELDLPTLDECLRMALQNPAICLRADGSPASKEVAEAYQRLKGTDIIPFALQKMQENYDKYDRYYCENDLEGPEEAAMDSSWALLEAIGGHVGYEDIHFFQHALEKGLFRH